MRESRVERYSKKNRAKRNLKKKVKGLKSLTFKKILKFILKNLTYLVVGIAYACYLVLRTLNNLIAKLFMKLPRIMKVVIIYLLIFNFGREVYNIFENNNAFKTNEFVLKIKEVTEPQNIVQEVAAEEPKEEVCRFDSTSCLIYAKAKEIGMTEEEILISISISKWETGNYDSSAFKNLNNVGGMMCNSGLIKYNSLDEGISAFLNNLKKNYFGIGLNTFEKIQPKYCPIGAKNDPQGLNKNWLNGTQAMYNELVEK